MTLLKKASPWNSIMSGAFAPMAEKLNAKEKPVESGTRSDTETRRMRKEGMGVERCDLGLGKAINGGIEVRFAPTTIVAGERFYFERIRSDMV
jgi:hypothetical protein